MDDTARAPDADEPNRLARRLGLATAAAMVVSEVIGVGIFLTPAEMARSLGSPFWLIAVWLIMGASAIGGALTFGGLAARYPEAGGVYVYLREAYGQRAGFLYGWLSMLVTDPGLTAYLGVGLATYAAHLVPLSPWGQKGLAIASIAALAGVNMLRASIGSGVLRGLAGLKIGLLTFLAIAGFASSQGHWSNLQPFWSQRPGSLALAPAIAGGLILAFVSLAGWWDASKIAGEVRDPGRTMPRALLGGLSIATALYIAVSVSFLYLVGPERLASRPDDAAFAAMAGQTLFGRLGEVALAAVVVISVAGSLAAVLMALPRVYYAMARDGLFFPSFAAVDPRGGAPVRAIAIQAVLASALVLSGSADRILGYFMVPTLAFLALAVTAIFVLRRRLSADGTPGLVVPGYPVAPLVFLIPVLIVIVLQAARDPVAAAIGAGIVAAGLPAWALVVARRGRGKPGPAAAPVFDADLDMSQRTSTGK